MSEVVAYLSHARKEGGMSDSASVLVSFFSANSGELCNDTSPRRSEPTVQAYIEKLTTAHVVVFMLNQRFFESIWCVHELTSFVQKRNKPIFHGHFIKTEGWECNRQDMGAWLRGDFTDSQIGKWELLAEQESDPVREKIATSNARNLKSALELISHINLQDFDHNDEDHLKLVWGRVGDKYKRECEYAIKPPRDENFRNACSKELVIVLDRHELFRKDFSTALCISSLRSEEIVGEIIKKEPLSRLDVCINAISSFCKRIHADNQKENLISDLSEFIGLLLLSTIPKIEHSIIDDPHKQERYIVADESSFSGSLLVARFMNRPGTDLSFSTDFGGMGFQLSGDIAQRGQYARSEIFNSYGDLVDQQISLIWELECKRKGRERPVDKQKLLNDVNVSLRDNFVQLSRPRYLIVPEDDLLNNDALLLDLKTRLPYLFVIVLDTNSDGIQLLSPSLGTGRDFEYLLNRFADVLQALRA